MRKHYKTVLVVLGTLLISGAATAGAASLMSGSKIKKGSIPFNRLTKKTQKKIKKLGNVTGQSVTPGPSGPAGSAGAPGPKGETGSAVYSGAHWGLIDRNVEGSPVGALRSGPYEGTSTPPLGVGSLGFSVKDGTEKVAFGNELDFATNKITDITNIGFSVFFTGEDKAIAANNLPNITFEVDPNGPANTTAPNYSSLVFGPVDTGLNTNQFNQIDATQAAAGGWYFTNGATATATGCTQASMCSFSALQSGVAANRPQMSVLTLAVAKGKDHAWNGAIDRLQYNNVLYNFEPFGVTTSSAP